MSKVETMPPKNDSGDSSLEANRSPFIARAETLLERYGESRTLDHFDSSDRQIAIETIRATDYMPHVIRIFDKKRHISVPVYVRLEKRSGNVRDSLPYLDEAPTFHQGIIVAYSQARGGLIATDGILFRYDETNDTLLNRDGKKVSGTGANAFLNLLNKMGNYYDRAEAERLTR